LALKGLSKGGEIFRYALFLVLTGFEQIQLDLEKLNFGGFGQKYRIVG